MDIEQLEPIALGPDRAAAVAALLPGTAERDYWRAIALQHEGRLDEVDVILVDWRRKHPATDRLETLQRRQLLLRAGLDLAAHAEALRHATGVVFDDRAEVVVQATRFPSRLDPALLDADAVVADERRRRPDLTTLTDWALPALVAGPLDPTQRRNLLQRLTRANVPGIVALVAADLAEKSSAGFGSLPVHALLTLAQLEELAARRPELRSFAAWVDATLRRLRPVRWIDLGTDLAERERFLARLWTFVATLAPAFNGLKALVLEHQLDLDRTRGRYDRARFLAYLELPRRVSYAAREWLQRAAAEHVVQPDSNVGWATGLLAIDDEALVRDYLAHFLLEEDGAAFGERLLADWVLEQLATTRLLAGAPDAERWTRILGPTKLASLRDRVDIDLAPQNRRSFGATDDVTLEVDVKNVGELEVKVFRIDAVAYFLARGAEIDTSIDLDGMIAQDEHIVQRDASPMQRSRLRLDLPSCKRPGTYVVELIGNGRSSRALIRKGTLRHDVRVGAAGVVVCVRDEEGSLLRDARLWLGGRELAPRPEGDIVVPFSTRPGRVPILLVHGDLARRELLDHPSEDVALSAGFHLERESLVASRRARLLCRPTLTLAGVPVSITLLEDPRVEITVVLLDGTSTSHGEAVTFRDDAETTLDLDVPEGVLHVRLELRGRVRIVSREETVDVSDATDADLNTIHVSSHIEAAHLATVARGDGIVHLLSLLGKTGEPLAGRALAFSFEHRLIRTPLTTTLETDAQGVIDLGALAGILSVAVNLPSGTTQSWTLAEATSAPQIVHALPGETIVLPAPAHLVTGPVPVEDLQLTEHRGEHPAYDVTSRMSVDRHALVIEGLTAGEYWLSCRGMAEVIAIVVASPSGPLLELSPPTPLLREAGVVAGELVIKTSGTSDHARVHVFGVRYRPEALLATSLERPAPSLRAAWWAPTLAEYVSGRDIGDEYRYVIERRSATRRPGTMLAKPGPGGIGHLASDAAERELAPVLYRGADRTEEWAETGWWKRRVEEEGPALIPPNRFWRDLAAHDDAAPFLSPHLADCAASGAAALTALAFLDLPFAATPPVTTLEDTTLTVTPRSHALAAQSRIVAVHPADTGVLLGESVGTPALVAQSYVRADDRWEWTGTENQEKYVTGDFATGVVYGCRVIVTNPTSTSRKIEVLLQIPRGAVPTDRGFVTRTMRLELEAYGTTAIEYAFYFPEAGRFSHFPAHVTRNGELIAFAEPRELVVTRERPALDERSWAHVSQHGTVDDVLAFLDAANLGRVDLGRIAWRMHDGDDFQRVTARLAARFTYDDRLWRYALLHHDRPRAAEWLRHQESFLRGSGPFLDEEQALVGLDPVERSGYQHLEYAPLVNARAHRLGARRRILNEALGTQYRAFLERVAHRPRVTSDDLLVATHYLLTMDRVDEALTLLARVAPTGSLPYAYLAGYAAAARGDLEEVRRLATPWLEHPVGRWRSRFVALAALLEDGAPPPDERVAQHVAREATLELGVEQGDLALQHHALDRCELRFYRMDIELLFSRQPFVQGDVERFSWIEPGLVLDVPLTGSRTVVKLPPALGGKNLVIEAVARGLRRSVAHYAHQLGVQLTPAFGQVRVVHASTQRALPAAYVKVYARQAGGEVSFYKDGYTDLRGRFDADAMQFVPLVRATPFLSPRRRRGRATMPPRRRAPIVQSADPLEPVLRVHARRFHMIRRGFGHGRTNGRVEG